MIGMSRYNPQSAEELYAGECPHITLGFAAVHVEGTKCEYDSIPH